MDVLHPDLWAQYGNAEPAQGADTVIGWIREATKACVWQHHLLSVYHVDVEGDTASALVYHTSYQKFEGDDDVCFLVGRYHDELTQHEGTWKISRLVFEIMWGERRADTAATWSPSGAEDLGPVVAVVEEQDERPETDAGVMSAYQLLGWGRRVERVEVPVPTPPGARCCSRSRPSVCATQISS